MYLQYVPNRHVQAVFPGTYPGDNHDALDPFGMIPYTGKPLTLAATPSAAPSTVPSFTRDRKCQSPVITLIDEPLSFAPIVAALAKHRAPKPFYQAIHFTLVNLENKARAETLTVDAEIYAGTLTCVVKPSSDELRRSLLLARKEAARELYQKTNFSISLQVADDIPTGKL